MVCLLLINSGLLNARKMLKCNLSRQIPTLGLGNQSPGVKSLVNPLRVTEWQPRNGKRSRGRQARRWRDDIVRTMGNTWTREAKDKEEWRRGAEGLILQWMDGA
ncbi:endonuclease-reverse transcriptase [Elysia marginata]|uniref:Endonuclease-reverse transcriptase n=1 Tax=Elysia marginata TaxID=1093978 RepID=A0AAV4IPL7_9GAST|nr:endonuclease-reverse transcriptase [Elysia marginata]